MKKHDSRKLPKEVLQHNRNQAIRHFQEGKKRKEIAAIIGVHYTVVCKWIRAWNEGGEAAIKLKKRGRGSVEQRMLTEAQETALKKLLIEKNP